jgi:predicted O-methyltransferase YrrM
MSIAEYINSRGIHLHEGYSQQVPGQVADLIRLTSKPGIHVMEIGFNAGHSAELFLQNNSELTLISFDLGAHSYVLPTKGVIDRLFPSRHTLILGDSTVTVPNYISQNSEKVFDVIFIDGGHDYHIANADLENCRKLANKDTIVILDDTMYTNGWKQHYTIGPTKAWTEHIRDNKIIEIDHIDYCNGKGMSWGKYVF